MDYKIPLFKLNFGQEELDAALFGNNTFQMDFHRA